MSAALVVPPPQKRARRFTKLLVRRKRASLSRSAVSKVGTSTHDSDISSISSDASSFSQTTSTTEVLRRQQGDSENTNENGERGLAPLKSVSMVWRSDRSCYFAICEIFKLLLALIYAILLCLLYIVKQVTTQLKSSQWCGPHR